MSLALVLFFISKLAQLTSPVKDYLLFGSVLLNIVLVAVFYFRYYYRSAKLIRISIKRNDSYLPEFQVYVRNKGKAHFEIEPPVVVFKKKSARRLFQVRSDVALFPLALFGKDEYDFSIDLARFYNTDKTLLTYPKVYLEIRDKNKKRIARKQIRVK